LLEELRSGVASTLPGSATEEKLTLEEIFLNVVGGGRSEPAQELSWLS
jgi:ABC-2 type transport system ATP-binding protein